MAKMPTTMDIVFNTGAEAVSRYIPDLARMRISIFREYPYLYDGDMEYELSYLKFYTENPDAVIAIAADGDLIAGAVTGVPLSGEADSFTEPFTGNGWQIDDIYYMGELLFLPQYRNAGLGGKLLAAFEDHITAMGNYVRLVCATIIRPDDHPLKPPGFDPDRFWIKNGFVKHPELVMELPWKNPEGQVALHELVFWIKELASAEKEFKDV